jgi:hypothetical protein
VVKQKTDLSVGPFFYPPVFERNREVEQQAGNEKEIGETAATNGRYDQTGNDKCCAKYGNAPIDYVAIVHQYAVRAPSLAFL